MQALVYTVITTLPDAHITDEYVTWLASGHTAQVLEGGALQSEVCGPWENADGTLCVEARYVFANPEAFATYENLHAPRLRAEGVAKFGSCPGIRFERRTAPLVQSLVRPLI